MPIERRTRFASAQAQLKALVEEALAEMGVVATWFKRVGDVPGSTSRIGKAYGDSDPVEDDWAQFVADPSVYQVQPQGLTIIDHLPRQVNVRHTRAIMSGQEVAYCSEDADVRMYDVLVLSDSAGDVYSRVRSLDWRRGVVKELTLEVAP